MNRGESIQIDSAKT